MAKKQPTTRERVEHIRCKSGLLSHQKKEKITTFIIGDLQNAGSFFRTPQGCFYFFKGEQENQRRELFPLESKSMPISAFVYRRYGVNSADQEFNHILTGLQCEAYNNGTQVEVYRLSHYDPASGRLYVSRFDGTMYRLDGETIENCANGSEGVFFWDDPSWQPYELVERDEHDYINELLLSAANFENGDLSTEEQRIIFRLWCLSQFFDSLHPTKPLLVVCGERGGGKTSVLKRWLKFLFGRAADVAGLDKLDDFVATVTFEPVVVFDNVDERTRWIHDHLARLATGTSYKKRKYYTTNDMVQYKPNAWLAFTCRTPQFLGERDDLFERVLILQTTRFQKFIRESALLERLQEHRNRLWTQMLYELNQLVAYMRQHGTEVGEVDFRMADFASFAILVGRAGGRQKETDLVLNKIEKRQSDLLLDEEPIAVCLEFWLNDKKNIGRQVQSKELVTELGLIARRNGMFWKYGENAKKFGQRLPHLIPSLKKKFDIEDDKDSANQKIYSFRLKSDSDGNDQQQKSPELGGNVLPPDSSTPYLWRGIHLSVTESLND